jgi:uncharacterized protein YchJ
MRISFIAMNRIVERQAAEDPTVRRRLEHSGKVVLSHARSLPDVDLLAHLRSFGIELDPKLYRELSNKHLSAEEVSLALQESPRDGPAGLEEDWIWLSLVVLWERWLPDSPSFERLDDRIQEGYGRLKVNRARACEIWLKAWDDVLRLCEKGGIDSIEAFDDRFGGTQSLFNWVQDLEMELGNEARKNPRCHWHRMRVCEVFMRRFGAGDSLVLSNMRRALAESCFGIGNRAQGDALYQAWLEQDPEWGWGWIGWADNYGLFAEAGNEDSERAEALLRQGLSVENVRDRGDLLERLEALLEEQRCSEEVAEVRQTDIAEVKSVKAQGTVVRLKTKFDFGEKGLPIEELPRFLAKQRRRHEGMIEPVRKQTTGRNDPCHCGSGKKYKKCCGR